MTDTGDKVRLCRFCLLPDGHTGPHQVQRPVGKHSAEAADLRGEWLSWHNGSDVGSTPGFRRGGRARESGR